MVWDIATCPSGQLYGLAAAWVAHTQAAGIISLAEAQVLVGEEASVVSAAAVLAVAAPGGAGRLGRRKIKGER